MPTGRARVAAKRRGRWALRGQCLNRRIAEREILVAEVKTWQHQCDAFGARIYGMFTTQRARTKPARIYPMLGNKSQSLCRGTTPTL